MGTIEDKVGDQARTSTPETMTFFRNRAQIDFATLRVCLDNEFVELRPREFKLLALLVQARGRVCRCEKLKISGKEQDSAIGVCVMRIRNAFFCTEIGGETDPIRTVRGDGYAIVM